MSTLYTTNEVAAILKISRQRVLKLIADNRINAQKLGRDYFVSRDAIEEFKASPPRASGRPKKSEKP